MNIKEIYKGIDEAIEDGHRKDYDNLMRLSHQLEQRRLARERRWNAALAMAATEMADENVD